MSANPTPAADVDDFDAAVDAFLDAPQRPPDSGMAAAPATDPSPQGMAPVAEGSAPAASDSGEPGTTTEAQPEVDYKAEYEKLEAEYRKFVASELPASGRLSKANERIKALEAERDDFAKRVEDQNAAIDTWWREAIDTAPPEQQQQYREAYALDKQKREVAQERQQLDLIKQQQESRAGEIRQQAEGAARNLAIAEVDAAIDARARYEGLPAHLFQPVKDYIASPFMQKLAEVLPLRGERQLSGDPATWDVRQIPDLDHLHQYAMAMAENGFRHFRAQHAQAAQREQEQRVEQNAKAAQQTYQPERVTGAASGPPRRDWDDLDFDEAVDAFMGTNR